MISLDQVIGKTITIGSLSMLGILNVANCGVDMIGGEISKGTRKVSDALFKHREWEHYVLMAIR